jgi:hypothetical protein
VERKPLAVRAIEGAVDQTFEMFAADIAERWCDARQAFCAGFAKRLPVGKPQPANLADRRVKPVEGISGRLHTTKFI